MCPFEGLDASFFIGVGLGFGGGVFGVDVGFRSSDEVGGFLTGGAASPGFFCGAPADCSGFLGGKAESRFISPPWGFLISVGWGFGAGGCDGFDEEFVGLFSEGLGATFGSGLVAGAFGF